MPFVKYMDYLASDNFGKFLLQYISKSDSKGWTIKYCNK